MVSTLFTPTLGALTSRPIATGKVFFVASGGNDDNNGIDPDTPFATITHALTQCAANRGDYIYVLSSPTEAYPILIGVAGVHIIGVTLHGPWPQITLDGGGADCFEIQPAGDRVEIAGFGFMSNGADGIYAVDAFGAWIHHCRFGLFSGGQARNGILTNQPAHWLIEDCFFGCGNIAWSLSGIGISGSGLVGTWIRRNVFQNCTLGAVYSDSGDMELGYICDNDFFFTKGAGAGLGWAINLIGVDGWGGIITRNHAVQTGDQTSDNAPYRDLSTGTVATKTHGWGLNYLNDTPADPANA